MNFQCPNAETLACTPAPGPCQAHRKGKITCKSKTCSTMCGANLLEIQFLCINSVALLGLPGFRTFSKIWFFTDFHSITCLGLMEMGLLSWATLFRCSRSLQRPLLEYQKLASHHPRCFAELDICFFESSPPRTFQGGHKILYVGYQARVFSLHMKGESI